MGKFHYLNVPDPQYTIVGSIKFLLRKYLQKYIRL